MNGVNGTFALLDKAAALATLGVSHSTLDRMVQRGQLPVVKKVDRGYPKPSPLFDPRDVQALAARRRGEAEPVNPTPRPVPSVEPSIVSLEQMHRQLVAAVKALHGSQVVILDALQHPSRIEIEVELWHTLLTLTRSQERMLAEVLLGSASPEDEASDPRHP